MTLPEPRSAIGAQALGRLLQDPGSALLAFDFDGVLSPIVPDPEQAYAHPRVVPALRRIAPHVGALAIVTGRPARLVVRLGGLAGVPELDDLRIIGQYGLERMDSPNGELRTPKPHPGVEAVRREVPDLLASLGAPEGTHVEDKGHAVVVHTRRTADPAAALALLRGPLTALAERHGLAAEPGRMVLELRPPGMTKAVAVHALAAETEARIVMYTGDDLGDLPAYDAVDDLRDQGISGILVCSASAEVDALAERADLIVDGPEGVADMLDALADRLES